MPWGLADLANVAVRDTFGEATIYTPTSTGVPETITAVLDEAHEEIVIEGGAPHTTTRPVLTVVLDDLSVVPEQGDAVTVNGVDYEVSDPQFGGQGDAVLYLLVTS